MDMTIDEFCDIHDACIEGRKWAKANCRSMQDVWNKASRDHLIWVATRKGVLTDKELRLFAVWCCRQVQHLMTDARSVAAVDTAERFANGEATDSEMDAAWDAAEAAAEAAARAAARAAAWAAVGATAWDAEWAAARAAAWAAAEDAAGDAQCDRIRTTCKPNFSRIELQS